MDRGYIKLWRRSVNSTVWQNPKIWRLWIWCLLKATHKDIIQLVGYQYIELKKGQFIFGRKKCSKETGLSEKSVRTCLQALKSANNVAIKTASKFSIITIINWELYQVDDNESGHQNGQQSGQEAANKGPASGHKQTHKEHKEDISCRNGIPYEEIQKAFNEVCTDLPTFRDVTPQRKNAIKKRWHTDDKTSTLEWWRDSFFTMIQESDFLSGRNGKWPSCNIDWILKPVNFQKIREGTYNR